MNKKVIVAVLDQDSSVQNVTKKFLSSSHTYVSFLFTSLSLITSAVAEYLQSAFTDDVSRKVVIKIILIIQ